MILTVTLNPSMDSIYFTDTFAIGKMNRCQHSIRAVGGKGINAARTASILGSSVTALGVLAGINGQLIQQELQQENFDTHFITITGESRNAVTVMDQEKNQTELVEKGPEITSETEKKILETLITFAKEKQPSVIALCGSANTTNQYLYSEYIQTLQQELPETKILTDLSGIQLKHVLEGNSHPYFLKPNIHEFGELIGEELETKEDALKKINHPLLANIPFLLISCGAQGALARYNQQLFDIQIPCVSIVNPTGSGDATVGGVSYALDQQLPLEETLKYAIASGTSNAMEEKVGFVTQETVAQLMKQVMVERLN